LANYKMSNLITKGSRYSRQLSGKTWSCATLDSCRGMLGRTLGNALFLLSTLAFGEPFHDQIPFRTFSRRQAPLAKCRCQFAIEYLSDCAAAFGTRKPMPITSTKAMMLI